MFSFAFISNILIFLIIYFLVKAILSVPGYVQDLLLLLNKVNLSSVQFSCSVGSDSLLTLWTAACKASQSDTNYQSLLKLMSIESVMPSNHLILCNPHLLPPSIFHSIRIFSDEPVLCIRWPKYWSFNFSIRPSNEYSELVSFRMD